MRGDRTYRRTLKALFLGLLMVCAQSLAQAHEVLHEPAGEPELCTTCMASGGLNATPADATASVFPIPAAAVPAGPSICLSAPCVHATPEARGPPIHS